MTMATTVQRYLANNGIQYDTLSHDETMTASEAAGSCHVPGDCVAKAVVLKSDGGYVLAVIPASHHLRMGALRESLDELVGLATEAEIGPLFPDCEEGAVPALGAAYGLPMMVDDSLADRADIYFEGGDHRTMIHLSGDQFRRLTKDAPHGRFSAHD